MEHTVNSSTEELKAFCRKLDLGEHPDFLQVMTALAAATDYTPLVAEPSKKPRCQIFGTSQRKCRLCD